MKNLCFFWRLLFQNKNCWHFEFLMNQIFRQRFIIFEKLRYRGQLLLKLRAVEVATSFHISLFHIYFIFQYFESSCQKKCLLKVWIFGPSTTKWQPCKIFAKMNRNHLLMVNIFKLHEYQTFGLMKMDNMSKIWFANNKFSL